MLLALSAALRKAEPVPQNSALRKAKPVRQNEVLRLSVPALQDGKPAAHQERMTEPAYQDEALCMAEVALQDGEPAYQERTQRRRAKEPPIFEKLRHSKNVPISPRVRSLARKIAEEAGAVEPTGKARAFYDWITGNILYDTAEWENIASGGDGYIHEHDPETVLDRGTTVCIGYAWLFNQMCEAEGIEATWLIGDVRGYRGTPDETLVTDIRHAWNAVKLDDGQWHLLDATWGALQNGEEESAATLARANYYFDTPPAQFVYDHLPEEDGWQLLEEAVPPETAFSVLPNLKPTFFSNGLELGRDYTSEMRARANATTAFEFSAPAGIRTAATLGVAGNTESFEPIRMVKGQGNGETVPYKAVLPPLSGGDYILRLYSGDRGSEMLECSADFLIHAE